jgi:hypothetical protein
MFATILHNLFVGMDAMLEFAGWADLAIKVGGEKYKE